MTAFEPFYQLAAARGYLVFAPNHRGSNDRGNAYEHSSFNDASTGPGEDIMAGIRAVERLGIVDTKRIGVSGWSYGGQLTSWMIGHYQMWKCAVTGAAVQWLRDRLGIIKSAPEVEELAKSVDDNGGVYFVPAFSGLYAPY